MTTDKDRIQTLEHECARLTEELALARALNAELADALSGSITVLTRAVNSGRAGEHYSCIQARDGAFIDVSGSIDSFTAVVAKATGATHD